MKPYISIPLGKLHVDFGWYRGETPVLIEFVFLDCVKIGSYVTVTILHVKVAKLIFSVYLSDGV